MSQRHVLTRHSPVIETLGSATAICVDKTGTLTMNSMTVGELVVDGAVHVLDDRTLPELFHEIAEFAMLASPIDPFDPMDRAVKDLARTYLAGTGHMHEGWELVQEYPALPSLSLPNHAKNRRLIRANGSAEQLLRKHECPAHDCFFSAPGMNRTCDLRFRNRLIGVRDGFAVLRRNAV